MKIFVFVGPTLSSEDASSELDATYLPPAGQGDVLRAAMERPYAIGIIDGYFERVPAVWHKEILWALSQRIHVFGAASMGALRAAELSSFGMRGFGRIFSAFHSGMLEDDDEVAVAHGDASTGFRATCTALVNIRATLGLALERGIIDESQHERLIELAKRTFYPDRSYRRLLAQAEAGSILGAALAALRDFVTANAVDQKRSDAIELLRAMQELRRSGTEAAAPAFRFAHTEAWDRVLDETADAVHASSQSDAMSTDLLLAEVRLLGHEGRVVIANSLSRALIDELRASGVYARVKKRALRKQRLLAEHGLATPHLKDAGVDGKQLLSWFLEQRVGCSANTDLRASPFAEGLSEPEALEREALREFIYLRLEQGRLDRHRGSD